MKISTGTLLFLNAKSKVENNDLYCVGGGWSSIHLIFVFLTIVMMLFAKKNCIIKNGLHLAIYIRLLYMFLYRIIIL